MTNCCISYVSVSQPEYSTSSSTSKSALQTVAVSPYLLSFYHNNRSVRRIWFWRHSALIFTGFTCFFCGGILSEFVQAALPVESVFSPHSSFYILKAKRSLNTSSGVMFWFALSMILRVLFFTSALGKSSRI